MVSSFFSVENLECVNSFGVKFLNLSFSLDRGVIFSIIGSNGAGKSSILKSISGLNGAKAKSISLDGNNITNDSTEKRFKKGLNFISEKKGLLSELTVIESFNFNSDMEFDIMVEKYPVFKGKKNQSLTTLSGGELQLLAMENSFNSGAKVFLLDEPTSGLSPKYVHSIYQDIIKLKENGLSFIIVEQNPYLAFKYSDKIFYLSNNKLLEIDKNSSFDYESYYL